MGKIFVDEKLGFTLIHEHAIQSLLPMCKALRPLYPNVTDNQLELKPENLSFLKGGGWLLSEDVLNIDKDDHIDFMVNELEAFKSAGGNSLCECTIYGLRGRSVNDLQKMSA